MSAEKTSADCFFLDENFYGCFTLQKNQKMPVFAETNGKNLDLCMFDAKKKSRFVLF